MPKQIIQNNITKDDLFNLAVSQTPVERNLSSLEYQLDTLSQLVASLVDDVKASNVTLSQSTRDRLNDINQFLTQSAIDFSNINSSDENWKVPYAVGVKEKQRTIQKWYVSAKKRIFGSN